MLERVADAAPAVAPAPSMTPAASIADARTGWSVQLGAFSTNAAARQAWSTYSKRFAALDGFAATSHQALVNGKTYFRLTANGLGTRQAAASLCGAVKRSGGVCFVRNLTGREDVRWASRDDGRKFAAR